MFSLPSFSSTKYRFEGPDRKVEEVEVGLVFNYKTIVLSKF
jgi:hypothetical protein